MAKRRANGEGSIYQRGGDGRWVATLPLSNGRKKYFYGKTRTEVRAKQREAERELDQGIDLAARIPTLKQFSEKWLSSIRFSVKPKTYEGYESIFRVRVLPRLGEVPISKLTPMDLQALYSHLQDGGLSPRSISHTHRVLNHAFQQAVRWSLIARNPCNGAAPPRVGHKEFQVLTPEQVTTFLSIHRNHPKYALYILAVTTGMRQGELLGLRWSDIDLDSGRLHVRRALQQQRGVGLVFTEPKTSRSRRPIVLGQQAVRALREHRIGQIERRMLLGSAWNDHDLVFAGPSGGPLDPAWQRVVFRKALSAANLPLIRFHDLRHTAATLLLSRGVHPKVVSEMLGHSTITLTLDTYSHFVPTLHEEAAIVMDSILSAC
jgi:integrase